MGPVKYFKETWNAFDFVVVAFSLVELAFELAPGEGGGLGGLSVLRSFRLVSFVFGFLFALEITSTRTP